MPDTQEPLSEQWIGTREAKSPRVLPVGENPPSLLYKVEEYQNFMVVEFTTLSPEFIWNQETHIGWQAVACRSACCGAEGSPKLPTLFIPRPPGGSAGSFS